MNKVKPFYVRITDEVSPQTAREIKEKCIKQGVAGDFHFNPADVKRWKYLGVCSQDGVCYSDFTENFYGDAQEITLDQLDEWLGIESKEDKSEWKNGDECMYKGERWHFVSVLSDELFGTAVIFDKESEDLLQVPIADLVKPETQQQKAERERMEAIRDMCEIADLIPTDAAFSYIAKLYDAGYRKQ